MSYQNENSSEQAKTLYKPASWMAKIDFINQITVGTNGVLTIIGEPSSGKTSFATIIQEHADEDITTFYLNVSQLNDDESFIQQVVQLLQLESCHSVGDLLNAVQKSESQVLLIVDDAQFMSESLIRKILACQPTHGEKTHLNFCVIGTPELWDTITQINHEQSSERIHVVELGHFNEQETKEYMLHRLISQPDFFSKENIHHFYQTTDGRIGAINSEMQCLFNVGANYSGNEKHKSKRRNIKTASVLSITVALALGFGITLKPSDTEVLETTTQLIEVAVSDDQPVRVEKQSELSVISKIPSYDMAAVRQYFQFKYQPEAAKIALGEMDPFEKDIEVDEILMEDEYQEQTLNAHDLVKKPILSNKQQSTSLHRAKEGHYTVQILAGQDLSQLKRFAKQHDIHEQASFSKVSKNGKNWYVLTIGDYADHLQAKKAIQSLPHKLSQHKPWVRSFNHLQHIG